MNWKNLEYSSSRTTHKRLKELNRLARIKEQEQNRAEVESHKRELESLVSLHAECYAPIDWLSIYSSLPPEPPVETSEHRLVAEAVIIPALEKAKLIENATKNDLKIYSEKLSEYKQEVEDYEVKRKLARKVILRDVEGYKEAITRFNPFTTLPEIGKSLKFQFDSPDLITFFLQIHPPEYLPMEVKALTATGKLSTKQIKKTERREIYKDHVCACLIRVAREIHALLPVETVVANAWMEENSRAERESKNVLLSVAFSKSAMESIQENIDPSDFVLTCPNRMKVTKKEQCFDTIEPLSRENLSRQLSVDLAIDASLDLLKSKTIEIRDAFKKLIIGND